MEKLKQPDIVEVVEKFNNESEGHYHRYKSFDFCYSHFFNSKKNGKIDEEIIEKSCYVLWSYLGSWGMLRGSSFLLKQNPAYLKDLVYYIYEQDISVWEIDVDNYYLDKVLDIYKEIKKRIIKNDEQDLVLVTKIMLGIFGFIPAYDRFFCETFKKISGNGFTRVNEKTLDIIHQFYKANQQEIDGLQKKYFVCDFQGKAILPIKKAKIIDMYGFTKSLNK